MTKKHLPTVFGWLLLISLGVWFIFFATYHSENVARQSMMNKEKIEDMVGDLDKVLKNQKAILENQDLKKKLLDTQEEEIRLILKEIQKYKVK